jgi:hypothetical protein
MGHHQLPFQFEPCSLSIERNGRKSQRENGSRRVNQAEDHRMIVFDTADTFSPCATGAPVVRQSDRK